MSLAHTSTDTKSKEMIDRDYLKPILAKMCNGNTEHAVINKQLLSIETMKSGLYGDDIGFTNVL
jgi:hypothetical protein